MVAIPGIDEDEDEDEDTFEDDREDEREDEREDDREEEADMGEEEESGVRESVEGVAGGLSVTTLLFMLILLLLLLMLLWKCERCEGGWSEDEEGEEEEEDDEDEERQLLKEQWEPFKLLAGKAIKVDLGGSMHFLLLVRSPLTVGELNNLASNPNNWPMKLKLGETIRRRDLTNS